MGRSQTVLSRWRTIPMVLSFLSVASMALAADPARAAETSPSAIVTVDLPYSGAVVPGGAPIFIGGWAVDPGGRGTGVDRVEIYLDGAAEAGGVLIGIARYGATRPDVATIFARSDWANSGFNFDWLPLGVAPGEHTLYVYAFTATGVSAPQAIRLTLTPEGGRRCSYVRPCYLGTTPYGIELDTGGPGIYIRRFPHPL